MQYGSLAIDMGQLGQVRITVEINRGKKLSTVMTGRCTLCPKLGLQSVQRAGRNTERSGCTVCTQLLLDQEFFW